jgi:S1-C subfamily serine protease
VQIRGAGDEVQGSGSGIVLMAGQIVTNAHVAMGDDRTIEAWDGASRKARVVRSWNLEYRS